MANEQMSYDAPKVTRDEATELCVYHLRCAAGLFQLVPDDGNVSLRAEILRQNKDGLEEIDITPAMLWAASIFAAYGRSEERD
jgi:hypothetical protein